MQSLVQRVDEFVKSERQWERLHRIAYARRNLRLSEGKPDEIAFWREVLNRYKWRAYRATRA